MPLICTVCNQPHDELPDLGATKPDYWHRTYTGEDTCILAPDLCIIRPERGDWRPVRCSEFRVQS